MYLVCESLRDSINHAKARYIVGLDQKCVWRREVMNALWQKIQELREEHRVRHNQFWEDHKTWQQQNQEERRLK